MGSRGGAGPSVRKGVDGVDALFALSGDDAAFALGLAFGLASTACTFAAFGSHPTTVVV